MHVGNGNSLHQHNSDEFFESLVQDAEEQKREGQADSDFGSGIKSDSGLLDQYQYEEQKNRAHSISTILSHYEHSYDHKVRFQKRYRKILFWGCSTIIVLFAVSILCILYYAVSHSATIELAGVATVITAVLSLVVSMLELVHTITKYCFPENDDEYIVRIVESIQTNALETLRESNRAAEAKEQTGMKKPRNGGD